MATEKEWVLVFQREWHLRDVASSNHPYGISYAAACRNKVGGWSGEVYPTKVFEHGTWNISSELAGVVFTDNYNLVELKELLEVTVAMRGG